MTLDELLAAMAAFADKEALRKGVKEKLKADVYQHFFNDGHGVATAELGQEKKDLETKITTAEQRATDAEKKLDDWKKSNPDSAKLHEQYGNEIKALNDKHKSELEQREQQDQQREVKRAVSQLEATLIAKGVKPIHAKAIVKDDALVNRIKPQNGSVRVMQKDKDIAFAESELDKALGLLADEVIPSLEPDQLNSSVKRGSGRGTTVGDASGTGSTKKEQAIEEARSEVRRKYGREDGDESESAAPSRRRGKGDAKERLNQRMGLRTR